MILLVKDTANFDFNFEISETDIIVVHDLYAIPKQFVGLKNLMLWSEYKAKYNDISVSKVILVGLHRMITPTNRCDFIHSYLTSMTPNLPKIVIDTAPFVGEGWRAYYPYQYVNKGDFTVKFTCGYPAQGDYDKWFYKEQETSEFDMENLPKNLIEDTYTNLSLLKTSFNYYEPNGLLIDYYAEIKKFAFNKHNTPKAIIQEMNRLMNKHLGTKYDFDMYLNNKSNTLPNLKLYHFIVEENNRRKNIYNTIIQNAKSI